MAGAEGGASAAGAAIKEAAVTAAATAGAETAKTAVATAGKETLSGAAGAATESLSAVPKTDIKFGTASVSELRAKADKDSLAVLNAIGTPDTSIPSPSTQPKGGETPTPGQAETPPVDVTSPQIVEQQGLGNIELKTVINPPTTEGQVTVSTPSTESVQPQQQQAEGAGNFDASFQATRDRLNDARQEAQSNPAAAQAKSQEGNILATKALNEQNQPAQLNENWQNQAQIHEPTADERAQGQQVEPVAQQSTPGESHPATPGQSAKNETATAQSQQEQSAASSQNGVDHDVLQQRIDARTNQIIETMRKDFPDQAEALLRSGNVEANIRQEIANQEAAQNQTDTPEAQQLKDGKTADGRQETAEQGETEKSMKDRERKIIERFAKLNVDFDTSDPETTKFLDDIGADKNKMELVEKTLDLVGKQNNMQEFLKLVQDKFGQKDETTEQNEDMHWLLRLLLELAKIAPSMVSAEIKNASENVGK